MTGIKRKNPFKFLALLLAVALVVVLDRPMGSLPAIGRLIDPISGSLANAEPIRKDFTNDLKISSINENATVWFDDRLVPHIHAATEHDLFFIEGYIHAYFRLWQMDMETRAAAGRISEVVGEKAVPFDRKQRRKGMVYAAENSLRAMEAEPRTKQMLDAYTEGINAYIGKLNYRNYPLEYKLMGFKPERWSNLRSALLLKYMADDLTGKSDDIALTYLREVLPGWQLDMLFPLKIVGSSPVIPIGTAHERCSLTPPVAPPDSIAFPHFRPSDFPEKTDDGKGSNNWAISGSRTASGAAILCNDPHLGLNLPSLWYEVQLQAPGINVYGASLPGTPGVVIGFNENISWGFTNNYRDVKDFYLIDRVKGDKNKYWFEGVQLAFTNRVERVGIKGKHDLIDTVRYTIHGPLMYDGRYSDKEGMNRPLSMCWMAHKPTNEMLAIYLLNKATNYNQFVDAILNFQCPGQNMAYADRQGNIAIWGQGQFVNKWEGQGRYVMNGVDSSTLWKELIPMRENPHVFNPQQGYVASANQSVTDSSCGYWYNGDFVELRAWRINEVLAKLQKATIHDMFALQNDNYSVLAANSLPIMLDNLPKELSARQQRYVSWLRGWNYQLDARSGAASVFQVWWDIMYEQLWKDLFSKFRTKLQPLPERTMQLLQDTTFLKRAMGVDPRTDNGYEKIVSSFRKAVDSLTILERKFGLEWYRVKNTRVAHLAKLAPFGYDNIKIGGWGNTVNATKTDHGPSWRMVVQMGNEIEAYGVYPGGQSGNPGSKYYANFLPKWAEGSYYRLNFLPNAAKQSNRVLKYTWSIHH
jgi:penicillin amidase